MPTRSRSSSILGLVDLVVVALLFTLSVQTWGYGASTPWDEILDQRITVQNAIFVVAYLILWHYCLRGFGLYSPGGRKSLVRELRRLALACAAAVVALLPADAVLDLDFVTLPFVARYFVVTSLALASVRLARHAVLNRIRRQRRLMRNVLIIGDGDAAVRLASELMTRNELGYCVVSTVDLSQERASIGGSSWVLDRVGKLLETELVDEVFLAPSLENPPGLTRELISLCESQGILVRVLTNMANAAWEFAALDQVGGKPVFTVFPTQPGMVGYVGKRITDLVVASLGLVVLLPVFLIIGVAIKLDSPGSVFFVQERVGMHRRRLRMFKFRTMVEDAEQRQATVEHLNEATGHCFKIAKDPRITRMGRLLRRTSLDELPQLFNVLRGDMTLVGPRPLSVRDASRIDVLTYRRRFSVKPGITCLWQIRSRQPLFDDWMLADIEYLEHWSPALDFKILLKTIPAVLSGSGAQ